MRHVLALRFGLDGGRRRRSRRSAPASASRASASPARVAGAARAALGRARARALPAGELVGEPRGPRAGPLFVDCHSHVCPSGDDGAGTGRRGRDPVPRGRAPRDRRSLFATPHVWPDLPLTRRREAARPGAPSRELASARGARAPARLRADAARAARSTRTCAGTRSTGTECVLIEVPFSGRLRTSSCSLAAHTSRLRPPACDRSSRARGGRCTRGRRSPTSSRSGVGSLQVNSTSLLGRHGLGTRELGWNLVERGLASIVASDGHRQARPPHLDEA